MFSRKLQCMWILTIFPLSLRLVLSTEVQTLLEEVSSSTTGVHSLDSILPPRRSVSLKLHSVRSLFWLYFIFIKCVPYHRASRTKFFGCHWGNAGFSYRQLGMIGISPSPLHAFPYYWLLIPSRLHSSTSKRNFNIHINSVSVRS
jgi:hypothetical protein